MGKTVMIVDDQLGIRLLLQEIVQNEGHQVLIAENGKEALDKLAAESPDLLVVDFMLPILDGYAVLNQLHQEGKHIPTIVMSGLADEAYNKTKEFEMVKEIFAKPFNIEDARKRINELLDDK